MPPQSPNNAVNEAWTPEPELRESPPRRSTMVGSQYPDLNQPSKILYMGIGAVVLAVGVVLLFVGFAGGKLPLGITGIVLALGGAILVGLFPAKIRSYEARIEHLVTYGVPVMARVLSAENMTGDSVFGRSVKYQVVMPGGDLVHRSVNVDERVLPSRIPCDATALMDVNSGEVELYCALPRRAVIKGAPVSHTPVSPSYVPPTPSVTPRPLTASGAFADVPIPPSEALADTAAVPESGHMGTLEPGAATARPVPEAIPVPEPVQPEPTVEEKPKAKKPAGSTGLPWE